MREPAVLQQRREELGPTGYPRSDQQRGTPSGFHGQNDMLRLMVVHKPVTDVVTTMMTQLEAADSVYTLTSKIIWGEEQRAQMVVPRRTVHGLLRRRL